DYFCAAWDASLTGPVF
nr:immunoglobulin light chain junction region [Macaca mulatta]